MKIPVILIVFLFFFTSPLIYSQEVAAQTEEKSMYNYINLLVKKVKPDVFKAIEKEILINPVAIINFNFVGDRDVFENKHRQYMIKSIEGVYEQGNFFRFIKSVRALNAARLNEDLTKIEYINPKEKKLIDDLTKELNLNQYAIINLTLSDYKLSLTIQIKNIEKHENIWTGEWAVAWRPLAGYIYLGGDASFNLNLKEFPIFLNFSFGKSMFTLGTIVELGIFINPGVSFFNLSSPDNKIRTILNLGAEIRFNILEAAKVNYSFLEYFISFRLGIGLSYVLPSANFLQGFATNQFLTIGNSFIFAANYAVYFDVNIFSISSLITGSSPLAETIFLILGINYRFSI